MERLSVFAVFQILYRVDLSALCPPFASMLFENQEEPVLDREDVLLPLGRVLDTLGIDVANDLGSQPRPGRSSRLSRPAHKNRVTPLGGELRVGRHESHV